MQIKNFGRNVLITPVNVYSPENENEVLEILNRHRGQRIRCIGKLHSWSELLIADGVLLNLQKLRSVRISENEASMYADVGAGCPIKVLLQELRARKNWTLPSVGFITEQTIAGAIATGTHGSGRHSLSHYVLSVRLARYDPETGQAVIEEIHSGDELLAARCSLGCLGVILNVRMQCRPAYVVEEHFSEYKTLDGLLAQEPNYPLQQFYLVPWRWTYFAQHRKESNTSSSRLLPLYQWYRYLIFDWGMHLLIFLCIHVLRSRTILQTFFRSILPSFVVRRWCVTGPSNQQLVMEHELFRHVEIELFVPESRLASALDFLREVLIVISRRPKELPTGARALPIGAEFVDDPVKEIGYYCHHYPICVRKVLSDATLLSMASPLDIPSPFPYQKASRKGVGIRSP